MPNNVQSKVRFDDLAANRLSPEVCSSIDKVEIQIHPAPIFLVMANQRNFLLSINLKIPTKKLLTYVGTLVTVVLGAAKLINVNWPAIQAFLK